MSVDRKYRIRITGNRSIDLMQSGLALKSSATSNDSIDLDESTSQYLGSFDPTSNSHLTGIEDRLRALANLKPPQNLALSDDAKSPAGGAHRQLFPHATTSFEEASAPFQEDFSASEPGNATPKMLEERAPANPTGQSTLEAHALADLVNQTRQLYQALPAQRRSSAGQDGFELLSLVRQLHESFSEYAQAHVTQQELKDELTSLRLLIESKK